MQNIAIKNLNYKYPDMESPALKDVNLEIKPGEFVLVVGGSGSGKSSLLRAIAGLVPDFYGGHYSGEIYLGSEELQKMERRELSQKVGMVFQDPESQLVMNSVEEELVFGLENIELSNALMKRRVMEVKSALSLSQFKTQYIPELSGGQKQKTALGAVLAMQPEVILLDEPTSQLDPISGEDILTMIRRLNEENGITVVLTEQRLERCFHLADRIIVMEDGAIVMDHHCPKELANWAKDNQNAFIPPLVRLFANVGSKEIPVTVKQGRKILSEHCDVNALEALKSYTAIKCEDENGTEKRVELKNIWFNYDDGNEVLKNINLAIHSGEIVILMGENGGGKSTLMKHINGLLKPGRGSIKVKGQDTRKMTVEDLAQHVGYLSQNPNDYLFLPTVEEEVLFTMNNLGIEDTNRVAYVLEKLGIEMHRNKNPRDLSTGERQRVALASVLVTQPEILILDEPTRGLDYQLKSKLGELLIKLKEEGTAIFMVAHDVEFAAEYGDRIILLDDGAIVAEGDKHEVLTDSTFYSPQISKLFHNIKRNVVTFKQGEQLLKHSLQFKVHQDCG